LSQLDAEKFWLRKGKTWFLERKKWGPFFKRLVERQQNTLMRYLDRLKFQTILEVGCGYGRITKLVLAKFPNVVEIKAIDLSPHQIKVAKTYVNDDRVQFRVIRIQDLNIYHDRFDLVFGVSVLMHIPFETIEKAIENMVNASTKHIVNVDWYRPFLSSGRYGKSFAHDYRTLYTKFGVEKLVRLPIPKKVAYGISLGLDSGITVFRHKQEFQALWHATKTEKPVHKKQMSNCIN